MGNREFSTDSRVVKYLLYFISSILVGKNKIEKKVVSIIFSGNKYFYYKDTWVAYKR